MKAATQFLTDGESKRRSPCRKATKLIEALLADKSMQDVVLTVYADKFKDWPDSTRKHERFTK